MSALLPVFRILFKRIVFLSWYFFKFFLYYRLAVFCKKKNRIDRIFRIAVLQRHAGGDASAKIRAFVRLDTQILQMNPDFQD
ncbi:MAG: hypothetical protein BWK80_34095 [Desulfobacteraceae bacterium IS3]|nr:MAG: hypothetical protein BWK80_34095 [Desulfobacteraceae bacterium IS3]